ncbi:Electron transfer DM13 [Posidoniimonas corsicana]|uniref:Electron transfer DM13 n=1 Tax=Posidoniimonas corsicana TaxID=1938618 RepID=A0A5C5V8D7_9BACT|nr:DM13 domain-containing protein [Posidoniimonas corsicana]TWT34002.1 Electron transfer DM13 [Posidoniimonas corsicana]
MQRRNLLLTLVGSSCAALLLAPAAQGQPGPGWLANLSTVAHDVSGTVLVVDEDTLQVNHFTYDGGGISVYLYLGAADTTADFTAGLEIGPQLLGSEFDGTQPPLVIDLPAGQTIDGWNAISVWCDAVGVSFGSGAFHPPVGEIPGDFNTDGVVDAADYTVWRDNESGGYDAADYLVWRESYGTISTDRDSPRSTTAPEPGAVLMLAVAVVLPTVGRRPSRR